MEFGSYCLFLEFSPYGEILNCIRTIGKGPPRRVTVDFDGYVYIADNQNSKILNDHWDKL